MNRRTTQLLLAATAFAAPALLTACGSDAIADDRPANPGTTRTVDVADLLTDADTVYSDGADWFRLSTGNESLDGNGDLAHPCLAQGLSGLGATDVVRADFELRNSADPDLEVRGDLLTQLIGQYDDEAAAAAAYDELLGLIEKCEERPEAITDYRSFEPRSVEGTGDRAQIVDAQYGPLPAALEDDDSAYIMETGLALVGDRLTVITSVIVGQDYNFLEEDGGTPVNRMLPKAVDRLG